jgi:hypothetical protein
MTKKMVLLVLCLLLATFGFGVSQGFSATSDIQLVVNTPDSANEMAFTVDIDGDDVSEAYDVDLNGGGEVYYFQAGDTATIEIESFIDDPIDVYALMVFSGATTVEGEFWLQYTTDLDAQTSSSIGISFHAATDGRKKLTTLSNQASITLLDLYVTANVLDYPVTLWALSADPSTGRITGMDSKTILLNPDLTNTFLSEGGAKLTVDFGSGFELVNSNYSFTVTESKLSVITAYNVRGTFSLSAAYDNFGSAKSNINAMVAGQDSNGNYLVNVLAGEDAAGAAGTKTAKLALMDLNPIFVTEGGTNSYKVIYVTVTPKAN